MKKIFFTLLIAGVVFSCKEKTTKKKIKILSNETKEKLISELKQMKEADQLYRSYISIGTFDQKLIDSIKKLPKKEYIEFYTSHQSELTKKQEDSLWELQNQIDLLNINRLHNIITKYGWLNQKQLDSIINPIIFLFHTPKDEIDKMQQLLFIEVQEKRMEPILYATYIDNMRKKAFKKSQLYGTGDEFDPKTNSIAPPFIENIDSTNFERKKIGLPELKDGEYRTKN